MSLEKKGNDILSAVSAGLESRTPLPRRPIGAAAAPSVTGSIAAGGLNSARERADLAEAESAKKSQELAELKRRGLVCELDPRRVRLSRFANRHPRSFEDSAFLSLTDSVRATAGNSVPVLVRPLRDNPNFEYEIAYGSRRRAATEAAETRLNAFVREMDDAELLREMEAENSERTAPSPFEYGVHYARLLREGQYPNFREMGAALQVATTQLFKLAKYGDIHADVVAAFPDPREIRVNWVDGLVKASKEQGDVVRETISTLATEKGLTAQEIYRRITGIETLGGVITARNKVVARFRTIDGNPAIVLTRNAPPGLMDEIRALCETWVPKTEPDP